MTPRPVVTHRDIAAVQRLASRLWPQGWHPGGLGWVLARGQLAEEVVASGKGDDVAGWAARSVHEPGELLARWSLLVPTSPMASSTSSSTAPIACC